MCVREGLFDPATQQLRGRGVWPGEDNRLVCHCGDRLYFADRAAIAAGVRIGDAIYPARPKIPPPAKEAARPEAVQRVLSWLQLWRFRLPEGLDGADAGAGEQAAGIAPLLLGWIGLVLLGAALRWRVHALLIGATGRGKTTLQRLIGAIFGPQAVRKTDYSEAGLRQMLTEEARGLLLDEARSPPAILRP